MCSGCWKSTYRAFGCFENVLRQRTGSVLASPPPSVFGGELMRKFIILFLSFALLAGCGRGGATCKERVDQRLRHIQFHMCLEASASVSTAHSTSRNEAHETVEQCFYSAWKNSMYYTCHADEIRPDITEEWLDEWRTRKALSPKGCLLYTSPSPRDA